MKRFLTQTSSFTNLYKVAAQNGKVFESTDSIRTQHSDVFLEKPFSLHSNWESVNFLTTRCNAVLFPSIYLKSKYKNFRIFST